MQPILVNNFSRPQDQLVTVHSLANALPATPSKLSNLCAQVEAAQPLCYLFCRMSHTKPILETVAITEPRTQSASCHIEAQCRGALRHYHLTQQVPLQSSPPPTYEISLLQYWAASRPVARIFMATVADRRACRGLRATWVLHCMAQLGQHDLASCRGCGHYPTYRTCAGCHINWCNACHTWSQLCWKCYRPRHELNDCGEFLPGRGGPGGNGRFE
jgi:hypothetical protein